MNQTTESNKSENIGTAGGRRIAEKSGVHRKGRLIGAAILGVALIFVACFLLWAMYFYQGVYPNVKLAGMPVGGLQKEEARAAIGSVLSTYADDKIEISFEGHTSSISVLDAGSVLTVDEALAKTLDVGRQGNFFQRMGVVVSSLVVSRDVLADTETDVESVKDFLREYENIVQREKTEPQYSISEDKIYIDLGISGRRLDIDRAASDIAARIHARNLNPVNLEEHLVFDDANKINLLDIYNEICKDPSDAHLDLSGQEPKIIPHTNGVRFDLTQAGRDLNEVEEDQKELVVPLIITEPEITTEKFEELLFRDILSEEKTTLNASNLNRTGNVRLSANSINGKILNPGDVFSYNETVGQRTYERGYKDASVYTSGGIEDQLGGGICQTSSTLYMTVIRSRLEVVERANHAYTVVYAPLGEDATVYWGSLDFKFSNNQRFPIKIEAYQEKDYVVVRILGTKEDKTSVKIVTEVLSHTPYETQRVENPELAYGITRQKTEGHSAYRVETYRIIYDENGKEIAKEKLHSSRYKKLDRVLEIGAKGKPTGTVSPIETTQPSTSPSPTPSPTPSTTPPAESPTPSEGPSDDSGNPSSDDEANP